MYKFTLPLNLQLFADEMAADPGVETAPAAEVQTSEVPADQTGAEPQAAAEPEKQNNFEKAFAKRLAEAEKKWQADAAEKYKDYDDLKSVTDYFRELNQAPDVLSLKERIEMDRLQEAAEKQQVPVEVLKRLQELEAKASKVDDFEKAQQEQKQQTSYWDGVNKFAEAKGIDGKALNQFMVDNQMTYDPNNMDKAFEIASKAMRTDELAKQLEEAEKAGMKKLLQAKGSIPNVGGNKSQGQVTQGPAKTWAEARQRAMSRDYNPI